ncbi:hypothetical protein RF11_07828 [Thelohanellus kitauei]|uniref:Uncharacterized protein n=1 Tax=Thelohanellus kitauei TaxID=669202 RepID=A0A0C2JDY0_THEKT|nr:hypothetical protein RF11_07828 [Thelohanellus kitauei]
MGFKDLIHRIYKGICIEARAFWSGENSTQTDFNINRHSISLFVYGADFKARPPYWEKCISSKSDQINRIGKKLITGSGLRQTQEPEIYLDSIIVEEWVLFKPVGHMVCFGEMIVSMRFGFGLFELALLKTFSSEGYHENKIG